jgi:myotubularin-related protein 6/7/8
MDVFESVRELTVISAFFNSPIFTMVPLTGILIASVRQLYAFFYQPVPPFTVTDGWDMYSPRAEFARMGVGSRTKAWRFTDLNQDYSVRPLSFIATHVESESYPFRSKVVSDVPSSTRRSDSDQ